MCHPGLTSMGWLISFLRSIACHYFLSTGNCKKNRAKSRVPSVSRNGRLQDVTKFWRFGEKNTNGKKMNYRKRRMKVTVLFFSGKLFLTHKNKWKKIILKFFENVLSLFLVKYIWFFVLLLLFPKLLLLISMLAHGWRSYNFFLQPNAAAARIRTHVSQSCTSMRDLC